MLVFFPGNGLTCPASEPIRSGCLSHGDHDGFLLSSDCFLGSRCLSTVFLASHNNHFVTHILLGVQEQEG